MSAQPNPRTTAKSNVKAKVAPIPRSDADAYEDLYRKLIRLDATAEACRTAFEELPYLKDPDARRICARCYVLIGLMADEARQAVLDGERHIK